MEEKIIIRNSIPEDAERIGEIFDINWTAINQNYKNLIGDELYAIYYGDLKTRMEGNVKMIKERSLDSKTCIVTLVDGVVAAFATYRIEELYGARVGIVGFNGCDPAYKGRGIAGKQYAWIYDEMRKAGCVAAKVHTGLDDMHAPARRAYEKSGFEKFLPDINYFMMLKPEHAIYNAKPTEDNIVVREVKPSDKDRLFEITRQQWTIINENYKACIGDELYAIFYKDVERGVTSVQNALVERMEAPERFVVTEVNGVVAGYATYRVVDSYGNKCGIVGYNAVDNDYKGRGIAGRQYALLYKKMLEEGCVSAKVHTGLDEKHAPARRAYEKSGFEKFLPDVNYYMMLK